MIPFKLVTATGRYGTKIVHQAYTFEDAVQNWHMLVEEYPDVVIVRNMNGKRGIPDQNGNVKFE